MSRGFVTIATGSEKYYRMALNWLYSFRITNREAKAAIITDQANPLTADFDDVVILNNPHNNYLDKLALLHACPYDENIFIDADCLIFNNLDYLWDCFLPGTDFSSFGYIEENDQGAAWFTYQGAGKYRDQLNGYVNLHGGIYFIRKGEYCEKMWKLCMDILASYKELRFKIFREPADEPVLALASSIMRARFVQRMDDICFYPLATHIKSWFSKKKHHVKYRYNGKVLPAVLIHFGSGNIGKARYQFESERIRRLFFGLRRGGIRFQYVKNVFKEKSPDWKYKIYSSVPNPVRKIWHSMIHH